jgi:hypothetical protein
MQPRTRAPTVVLTASVEAAPGWHMHKGMRRGKFAPSVPDFGSAALR